VNDPSPSSPDTFKGRVRIPEHVVHRAFEAQMVLLNLQTGQYHGLNPTGGRMVELLEETGSPSEVAALLAKESGLPLEQVAGDVSELCAGLHERGLLEVEQADAGP
jgi:hypothetical protein